MLIAQTSDGIARVARDTLELLDHPSPLDDFIIEGRLTELEGLKTRRTSRDHARAADQAARQDHRHRPQLP
jgi:hypothetical protein